MRVSLFGNTPPSPGAVFTAVADIPSQWWVIRNHPRGFYERSEHIACVDRNGDQPVTSDRINMKAGDEQSVWVMVCVSDGVMRSHALTTQSHTWARRPPPLRSDSVKPRQQWGSHERFQIISILHKVQMFDHTHLVPWGSSSPPLDDALWLPSVNQNQQKGNEIKGLEESRREGILGIITAWIQLQTSRNSPIQETKTWKFFLLSFSTLRYWNFSKPNRQHWLNIDLNNPPICWNWKKSAFWMEVTFLQGFSLLGKYPPGQFSTDSTRIGDSDMRKDSRVKRAFSVWVTSSKPSHDTWKKHWVRLPVYWCHIK